MQVTSLATFMKAVEQIVRDWTPNDVDWYLQPWFRGHGDVSWSLQPGWYRLPTSPAKSVGDEYYSEASLLETFKLRAPIYLERIPATDWEWLFLMQHYGLPTRLLDWTESSLIALYFAVRDNDGETDAAVWAMSPWGLNHESFGKYVLFPADDARANDHAPVRDGQKLKGRLPLAITPVRASQRIAAQRGMFTIHGREPDALDRIAHRNTAAPHFVRRIVIPRQEIAIVRRELAISGISESLIFPELSGLCREIKREFFAQ